MRESHPPSPSVVVGIDGSRAAITAALWAVDEAVERDIPLRLVYVVDADATAHSDTQGAARDLATAEIAIRQAFIAVESTDKPVKIEVQIKQGRATQALIEASAGAAMVCLGAIGLKHSAPGHVPSTAAALAASAHCPVAVIRGYAPASLKPGSIVVEIDETTASNAVLERGIAEARLRGAPVRVLSAWQSRFTDIHDTHAVDDGNRIASAQLDRRLASWKRQHPELDIRPVVVHGSTLNYLARHTASIQLVVVGHCRQHSLQDVVGPPSHAALHDSNCSVLICEPRAAL